MAALALVGRFVKFAAGVLVGLLRAFATDINVFLLGLAALILCLPVVFPIGIVLVIYVLLRRADEYASLFASKADLFVRVIGDDQGKLDSRSKTGS